MSQPVFRACLHRTHDGSEAVVVLEDAEAFLLKQAVLHFRAMPAHRRVRPGALEEALEAAFADAGDAIRRASLRI
jgi:hypothetical protein